VPDLDAQYREGFAYIRGALERAGVR
jgi:hypothetical protein